MHTFRFRDYSINVHSDFSGNACIQYKTWDKPVDIPCDVLLSLAAEYVRANRIGDAESMSVKDLLK